jgi:hypothetical protein
MKNITLAAALAVVVFCSGCGESTASKKNRTLSQIEVLADQQSREIGEDGWFKRKQVEDVDAWGNKVELKFKRSSGVETVVVWSNGPDGLPFTRDDISSHSYSCYNSEVLAEIARIRAENAKVRSKDRQESVENYGFHLTKGLTKGVREGWQDRDKK